MKVKYLVYEFSDYHLECLQDQRIEVAWKMTLFRSSFANIYKEALFQDIFGDLIWG